MTFSNVCFNSLLLLFVIFGYVYGDLCRKVDPRGKQRFISCEHGCCGSYPTPYCCKNIRAIVGASVSSLVVVIIIIGYCWAYCTVRRDRNDPVLNRIEAELREMEASQNQPALQYESRGQVNVHNPTRPHRHVFMSNSSRMYLPSSHSNSNTKPPPYSQIKNIGNPHPNSQVDTTGTNPPSYSQIETARTRPLSHSEVETTCTNPRPNSYSQAKTTGTNPGPNSQVDTTVTNPHPNSQVETTGTKHLNVKSPGAGPPPSDVAISWTQPPLFDNSIQPPSFRNSRDTEHPTHTHDPKDKGPSSHGDIHTRHSSVKCHTRRTKPVLVRKQTKLKRGAFFSL